MNFIIVNYSELSIKTKCIEMIMLCLHFFNYVKYMYRHYVRSSQTAYYNWLV